MQGNFTQAVVACWFRFKGRVPSSKLTTGGRDGCLLPGRADRLAIGTMHIAIALLAFVKKKL